MSDIAFCTKTAKGLQILLKTTEEILANCGMKSNKSNDIKHNEM